MPPWLLTALCGAAILWLTLAPRPLGDLEPPLFPGADKLVHAIMFGGLTAMMLLDRTRRNGWHPVRVATTVAYAGAASGLGVAIEFVQRAMGMGRGYDALDMAADTAGAFIVAVLWQIMQKKWSRK